MKGPCPWSGVGEESGMGGVMARGLRCRGGGGGTGRGCCLWRRSAGRVAGRGGREARAPGAVLWPKGFGADRSPWEVKVSAWAQVKSRWTCQCPRGQAGGGVSGRQALCPRVV